MFSGSSPYSDFVDATFLTIVGISLLVFLGLLIAMVYFVVGLAQEKSAFYQYRGKSPAGDHLDRRSPDFIYGYVLHGMAGLFVGAQGPGERSSHLRHCSDVEVDI